MVAYIVTNRISIEKDLALLKTASVVESEKNTFKGRKDAIGALFMKCIADELNCLAMRIPFKRNTIFCKMPAMRGNTCEKNANLEISVDAGR